MRREERNESEGERRRGRRNFDEKDRRVESKGRETRSLARKRKRRCRTEKDGAWRKRKNRRRRFEKEGLKKHGRYGALARAGPSVD